MATPGSEPQPFVPSLSVSTLPPHHHAHHHHQHHGGTGANGGVGGGGGGGGGGGSSGGFNLPLNRGLERALEEAANSGGLNLSARKLKEFPRTAAPGHDLSDTVQADLSKNRLVEVPMELCHFVSLESLNLHHNCIRVVPEAIVNLQMLTYLNLSRNQLSALPACLCALPLRVLIASNNKLCSLPEEIGQLTQLMELDVSCNEITALPQQIGQLKSLRELNVRRNYLEVLPQELVDLPLVKFDFSCNKVLGIPVCFREMKQLQVLLLENNPLQSPPAQICTKGKVHIFKYLSIQACQMKAADSLYLHTMDRPQSQQHVEDSKKDSDSGVGSDNGDKRLSATEPSDEDAVGLSVPMSHIKEEEQIAKEDPCPHLSPATGDFHQEFPPETSPAGDSNDAGEARDRFTRGADVLRPEFVSYTKGRAVHYEEPLRIEEDTPWPPEGTTHPSEDPDAEMAATEPLRDADLLPAPNRLSTEAAERSGVNLYPNESAGALELQDSALNGEMQPEASPGCEVQDDLASQSNGSDCSPNEMRDTFATVSPATHSAAPFGLKPRSGLTLPISFNKLTQAQTWDRSSYSVPPARDSDNAGAGLDVFSVTVGCPRSLSPCDEPAEPERRGGLAARLLGGDGVFLRPQRNLESIDPQFTIRRKMEQMREEKELVEQLRESIEMRLKVSLHEDLGAALLDGVVLCHLVNHIRPRSVASIHVPSPAVPKLSMAKCRRNVENFLEACRKLGVPEDKLCLPHHILEEKGLVKVGVTVQALLDVAVTKALFT